MKIRVKEMAFYAGARRRPGDELDDVPDDLKGGWFDVVAETAKAEGKSSAKAKTSTSSAAGNDLV